MRNTIRLGFFIGLTVLLVQPSITAAGPDTFTTVLQNNAFAHLEVISGIAQISAGFNHPDDPAAEVRITWQLYAWNEGSATKDLLSGPINQSNVGNVDVNTSLSVSDYDFYQLWCILKTRLPGGDWDRWQEIESRFSKVAPYNGIGERTGEVTSDRAILHTYVTEKPMHAAREGDTLAIPGMGGYVKFEVYDDIVLSNLVADSGYYPVDDYINFSGEWRRVNYNMRWTVTGLQPDTQYFYRIVTRSSDGFQERVASNINSFRTSPLSDQVKDVTFTVMSNLDVTNTVYSDTVEADLLGLKVFASMLSYSESTPDFVVMNGDTVYYDGGTYSPEVGDYPTQSYLRRWLYWYAQYQFDNSLAFFQQIPGYWMVDDHDYWENNINYARPDGWYIFRNVNPTVGAYGTTGEDAESYYSDNLYGTSFGSGSHFWRAIRWGKHLEIFLEEGRHHRDVDNNLIWGDDQRQWLEQSIKESPATFKVLITSTPILGPLPPDDYSPSIIPDKHANEKFRDETLLFLEYIKEVPNLFLIVGDRHYKFHGVVNTTNYPDLVDFNEFGVGAAAGPPHANEGGWLSSSDLAFLEFADRDSIIGACAGYLRVEVSSTDDAQTITFKLIAVIEESDNTVVYSQVFEAIEYSVFIPLIF